MMVAVPAFVFYVAAVALTLVSLFLIALLYYLTKAVRLVLRVAEYLRREGGRLRERWQALERAAALAAGLFDI